jgi:hypothetical protein
MTPGDFAAAFGPTARLVSAGTGIDPVVLLAQWANETAWGTAVVGNNLGNIRCSPTSFCRYVSLEDFAAACVATFHNGFYDAVLAAPTADAQLAAIVASPWSSGHYGGSLQSFYVPLEVFEMTPEEHQWLQSLHSNYLSRNKPIPTDLPGGETVLDWFTDWYELLLRIKAQGPVDHAAILAAIADLKAHPSFDPNDATILAIVQRIEGALRTA